MALDESDNLIRFLGQNQDLNWFTDEGVRIHFIDGYLKEGWIQIAVLVDEHTTRADLERAYPLAKKWRERLLDFQGPWLDGGVNGMFERYYQRHRSGRSYSQLADHINNWLAQELDKAVTDTRESNAQGGKPGIAWFVIGQAIEAMVAWGLSEEKAKEYWQAGEVNVQGGCPPWPKKGEPISRELVRAQIRAWQKKVHSEEANDDVEYWGW